MTPLGQVYTPPAVAARIVGDHGVVRAWLEGASVLDPTAGDGSFLEALVVCALREGVAPSQLPLHRLHGIERNPLALRDFVARLHARHGLRLPADNLRVVDLFEARNIPPVDWLVGNPPWVNYVDLDEAQRAQLRPHFHACGLVRDARRLLLGGSRIDLAALVIAWSIRHHLRPHGEALFLAPLSLYLNDGAHEGFRRHQTDGVSFALRAVWDHRDAPLFPEVATRHGLLHYTRDARTQWPVPWHACSPVGATTAWARPCDGALGPLAVGTMETATTRPSVGPGVSALHTWRPRQGANTCGATDLFVFDRCVDEGDTVRVSNKLLQGVRLPKRYVLPLMTTDTFRDAGPVPRRWMLVPHDADSGRPLNPQQVEAYPDLARHLHAHRTRLQTRKGTMLGTHLRRGHWWALLGVGPYAYSPWRVAWEAFGRSTFRPVLLGPTDAGPWQGNQALHAYVPVADAAEGASLLETLSPARVEPLLQAHRMEGTCNWAQPGRIARILAMPG